MTADDMYAEALAAIRAADDPQHRADMVDVLNIVVVMMLDQMQTTVEATIDWADLCSADLAWAEAILAVALNPHDDT